MAGTHLLTYSDFANHKSENLSEGPLILHDGPPYANGDLHMGAT
jgi:isoleucyl-tRNA synthetase